VLRLRAPAPEAVLVGAALVGLLRSQTAVATKAARLVLAACGKPVYEIGVRSAAREAALLAARSAHVGGVAATANAVAAIEFGLPTMPIIPISLVAALGGAVEGLEACGVLVDGALANEGDSALAALTVTPRAVIVDAGTPNLADRVASLRAGIQSLGWRATKILVGGRVDEEVIDSIEKVGVAADGFCVGGELVVANDSPCIGFDYELVEREIDARRIPLARRDGGVGRRSVWRRREAGKFKSDTVQPESKAPPSGGIPLLVRVMEKGRRLFRAPSLAEVRVLCGSQLSMLDAGITRRTDPATYTVSVTIEPKKGEAGKPKAAAAPPQPAAPPPKGETLRADEARRRALSQIDDSSDFSAVSGAFESVVAANLGDDSGGEAPVEPFESGSDAGSETPTEPDAANDDATEVVASQSDEERADDTEAEETSPEEPPSEAVAPEEEASDDASFEETPSEELADDETPEHSISVAKVLDEALTPDGSPDSEAAQVESHDLMRDLAADGLIEMLPSEEPPPSPVQKRGATTSKPAPSAKAPSAPKPVAPSKPAAAAHPVAAARPVASSKPAPTVKASPMAKPTAAAKPVAPSKPVAAPKAPAPKHVVTEPPLPTFGAEPDPPPPSDDDEPVSPSDNPLLVAAARLRSLQRGETPPAMKSSPNSLESEPPPPAPSAKPAEPSGNPLLAAAARLKSLRGS
jgi:nicotinate phosphoribosyltransferase